jgi:NTP pyrophosphatase (non-canonical NTP hydrolase)
MNLQDIQNLVHLIAASKGWHDDDGKPMEVWADHKRVSQILMLIVGELAEAHEAVRDDDIDRLKVELADAAIILLNLAETLGIDLTEAILEKCEINRKRERMHGGKRC